MTRGVAWNAKCLVDSCDRKAQYLGYCAMHYQRMRNTGQTERLTTAIDFTGERYGKLVAIRPTTKRVYRSIVWIFRCDCGKEIERVANTVEKSYREGNVCSCRDCIKSKLPPGEVGKRAKFTSYKNNAKKRGIEFHLTNDEMTELFSQNCHYCGRPPSNVSEKSKLNGKFVYQGIDRIDNNKGYTLENCVPCCDWCNWAKKDLTVEEFLNHIRSVAERSIANVYNVG